MIFLKHKHASGGPRVGVAVGPDNKCPNGSWGYPSVQVSSVKALHIWYTTRITTRFDQNNPKSRVPKFYAMDSRSSQSAIRALRVVLVNVSKSVDPS